MIVIKSAYKKYIYEEWNPNHWAPDSWKRHPNKVLSLETTLSSLQDTFVAHKYSLIPTQQRPTSVYIGHRRTIRCKYSGTCIPVAKKQSLNSIMNCPLFQASLWCKMLCRWYINIGTKEPLFYDHFIVDAFKKTSLFSMHLYDVKCRAGDTLLPEQNSRCFKIILLLMHFKTCV